jgi:AraC-like DNA-binding protein
MSHLKERVLFAGPGLRLLDVRCRESSPACSAEERAESHQLVLIRSGVFVKHPATASRDSLVAEPMHALFLNQDEPFRISHPTRSGDDCTVLEIAPDALVDVMAELDPGARDRPGQPFRLTHAPFTGAMRLELHRVRCALARREGGAGLAAEERLLHLLARVLADGYRAHGRSLAPRRDETRRARRELVERTRHALAVAPGAPWSLGELARQVGSSPYHLTRVFRAGTGLPVHQYLMGLRLSLALERLGDARGRLSAVALDAGFASHSHFTTAFRRTFGVPPAACTA